MAEQASWTAAMLLRNISPDFLLVLLLLQTQGKKMFLTGTAFWLLHYGEIFSFRQRVVEVSILCDIAQRQYFYRRFGRLCCPWTSVTSDPLSLCNIPGHRRHQLLQSWQLFLFREVAAGYLHLHSLRKYDKHFSISPVIPKLNLWSRGSIFLRNLENNGRCFRSLKPQNSPKIFKGLSREHNTWLLLGAGVRRRSKFTFLKFSGLLRLYIPH